MGRAWCKLSIMLSISQNGWVSRKLWRNFDFFLKFCDGKTCIKSRYLLFGVPDSVCIFHVPRHCCAWNLALKECLQCSWLTHFRHKSRQNPTFSPTAHQPGGYLPKLLMPKYPTVNSYPKMCWVSGTDKFQKTPISLCLICLSAWQKTGNTALGVQSLHVWSRNLAWGCSLVVWRHCVWDIGLGWVGGACWAFPWGFCSYLTTLRCKARKAG